MLSFREFLVIPTLAIVSTSGCSLTAVQVHIAIEGESYLERLTPKMGEAVLFYRPDFY